MAWWMLIPAAMSAVSTVSKNAQAREQNTYQRAWNSYNASTEYGISMGNIAAQTMLGTFNAQAALAAGQAKAEVISRNAAFNSKVVDLTTMYNDSLLEEDLVNLWDSANLDLKLLHNQRAVERGSVEATQAASGTVMGEGSNAEVVIDQKTQESLDAFVIRHGADIRAAKIQNARAQNLWQGDMQIKKIQWEGKVGLFEVLSNSNTAASGIMAETMISGMAGAKTAEIRRASGLAEANQLYGQNSRVARNELSRGLFSSAGQAGSSYYGSKDAGSSLIA